MYPSKDAAVPAEDLPSDLKELVQAYLSSRPKSCAARLRPRLGRDEDQWFALYGTDRRSGIVGVGPTVITALVSWEANYREAVTTEQ